MPGQAGQVPACLADRRAWRHVGRHEHHEEPAVKGLGTADLHRELRFLDQIRRSQLPSSRERSPRSRVGDDQLEGATLDRVVVHQRIGIVKEGVRIPGGEL